MHGCEACVHELKRFSAFWGWGDVLAVGRPELLKRRASWLFRGQAAIGHREMLAQKLLDDVHPFRVYRFDPTQSEDGCYAVHGELDGIVLPANHPFFERYMPPSQWTCRCVVYGAKSPKAARRFGGDPGKQLPSWATDDAPCTGHPMHVDPLFSIAGEAGTTDFLRAIWRGTVDHLEQA